jgi:hypothetical protein
MPIHDWTKVRANRFHAFHQDWTVELARALNRGMLPDGYSALPEQRTGLPEGDVVTLRIPATPFRDDGGTALLERPVKTRHVMKTDAVRYADKSNAVTISHPDGVVVAVIEIISPGNKSSRRAITMFTRKAARYLRHGVNLLIVDLFPPCRRDPQGIHPKIWERIEDVDFTLPPDKPLTCASYHDAGGSLTAYVEPVAVGDSLPSMPIFLNEDRYVECPLESTYAASWEVFPKVLKGPMLADG